MTNPSPDGAHVGDCDSPLFVVGPSRSGTSLMRALLNRHPDVGLAGETHYFDDLRLRLQGRELTGLTEDDRSSCEQYFMALAHRPYGHDGNADAGWLGRAELRAAADGIGDGADAYFEAFCRLSSQRRAATRWGEKTPRHVFRIDEILGRYPTARIVAMVRDPRAVVASYRDWKVDNGGFDLERDPDHQAALERDEQRTRRSYHPILLSLLWRSQAGALDAASARRSANVRVVRYEDLVSDPAHTVEDLATWLGLDYLPGMLDVPILNSSFTRFTKGAGVSTEAVERWAKLLTPQEVAAVQSTCGSMMRAFGYTLREAPFTWKVGLLWAGVPMAGAQSLHANRARIAGMPRYVLRRVRFLRREGPC